MRSFLIILLTLNAFCNMAWGEGFFEFIDNTEFTEPVKVERWIKSKEDQMSCSHIQRRYGLRVNILEGLRVALEQSFNNKVGGALSENSSGDQFDYFSKRSSLNLPGELYEDVVHFNVSIEDPEWLRALNSADGWGVYTLGDMEITAMGGFKHLPINWQATEKAWTISMSIDSSEVCLSEGTVVFLLSDCEKRLTHWWGCEDCPPYEEINWNSCREQKSFRLDFSEIKSQMGRTGQRTGRRR